MKNDLLLRAARGERTERPPVWLMRQAGRILPEYRALRSSVSGFKELVETPDLAAEVTLQPVDILGVDAAIIFSDILVIPDAMGWSYSIVEKTGPVFENSFRSKADFDQLHKVDPNEHLGYVLEAIRLVKKELNGSIPLIGFCGAPWTILAYMVEGGGSKTFSHARRMLYQEPEMAQRLLDLIVSASVDYLKAQVDAGADIVQIFDSWAGMLSQDLYRKFAFPAIEAIAKEITDVPVIVFPKGAPFAMEMFRNSSASVIGLDWTMNLADTKRLLGDKAVQGNLDPCQLYGPPQQIRKAADEMIREAGDSAYIANLGHGVYPDTPLDGVKAFIHTVQDFQW